MRGLPGTEAFLQNAGGPAAPRDGYVVRTRREAPPDEYVYQPRQDAYGGPQPEAPTWTRYDPRQRGVDARDVTWLQPFPECVSTQLHYVERRTGQQLHQAAREARWAPPHDLTCAMHEDSRERQVGEQYSRMLSSLPPISIRERTFQHAYDDERGSYVGPVPGEPWVRLRQRQDWTPEDESELAGYPYVFDRDRNTDANMRAQYANRLSRMPPTALRQA